MKFLKFLLVASLAVLTLPGTSFSAVTTAQKYKLNNQMGPVARSVQLGTLLDQAEAVNGTSSTVQAAEGSLLHRVAHALYDTGGSSTVGGAIGPHATGVSLPAKAIITRSYMEVETQFVDAGSGTVAVSCQTANNIYSAADITGVTAGQFIEGVSTGASTAFQKITSDCAITATVAGAAQSAGKLHIFVEYVVGK